MIIREDIGNDLIKTYSDQHVMIRSLETGFLYEDAIDPARFNRQYEETDIPCSTDEEEELDSTNLCHVNIGYSVFQIR